MLRFSCVVIIFVGERGGEALICSIPSHFFIFFFLIRALLFDASGTGELSFLEFESFWLAFFDDHFFSATTSRNEITSPVGVTASSTTVSSTEKITETVKSKSSQPQNLSTSTYITPMEFTHVTPTTNSRKFGCDPEACSPGFCKNDTCLCAVDRNVTIHRNESESIRVWACFHNGRCFMRSNTSMPQCICPHRVYGPHCEIIECDMSNANHRSKCTKFTQCLPGIEYEVIPPSLDHDRKCTRISPPCNFPENFEAQKPTFSTDRLCLKVTTCSGYDVEISPPSPTSNRICGQQEITSSTYAPTTLASTSKPVPSREVTTNVGTAFPFLSTLNATISGSTSALYNSTPSDFDENISVSTSTSHVTLTETTERILATSSAESPTTTTSTNNSIISVPLNPTSLYYNSSMTSIGVQMTSPHCSGVHCRNGGRCHAGICICNKGFSGNLCEIRSPTAISNSRGNITDLNQIFRPVGQQGILINPWHSCSNDTCRELYADGQCDDECYTAMCVFDGDDCMSYPPMCHSVAAGVCDFASSDCEIDCSTSECLWGNNACGAWDTSHATVSYSIRLYLDCEPYAFQQLRSHFLYYLSQRLDAFVHVREQRLALLFGPVSSSSLSSHPSRRYFIPAAKATEVVSSFHEIASKQARDTADGGRQHEQFTSPRMNHDITSRSLRSKRQAGKVKHALRLDIDAASRCDVRCIASQDEAVDYINAMVSGRRTESVLGIPILLAEKTEASDGESDSTSSSSHVISWTTGILVGIALVCTVVVTVASKRAKRGIRVALDQPQHLPQVDIINPQNHGPSLNDNTQFQNETRIAKQKGYAKGWNLSKSHDQHDNDRDNCVKYPENEASNITQTQNYNNDIPPCFHQFCSNPSLQIGPSPNGEDIVEEPLTRRTQRASLLDAMQVFIMNSVNNHRRSNRITPQSPEPNNFTMENFIFSNDCESQSPPPYTTRTDFASTGIQDKMFGTFNDPNISSTHTGFVHPEYNESPVPTISHNSPDVSQGQEWLPCMRHAEWHEQTMTENTASFLRGLENIHNKQCAIQSSIQSDDFKSGPQEKIHVNGHKTNTNQIPVTETDIDHLLSEADAMSRSLLSRISKRNDSDGWSTDDPLSYQHSSNLLPGTLQELKEPAQESVELLREDNSGDKSESVRSVQEYSLQLQRLHTIDHRKQPSQHKKLENLQQRNSQLIEHESQFVRHQQPLCDVLQGEQTENHLKPKFQDDELHESKHQQDQSRESLSPPHIDAYNSNRCDIFSKNHSMQVSYYDDRVCSQIHERSGNWNDYLDTPSPASSEQLQHFSDANRNLIKDSLIACDFAKQDGWSSPGTTEEHASSPSDCFSHKSTNRHLHCDVPNSPNQLISNSLTQGYHSSSAEPLIDDAFHKILDAWPNANSMERAALLVTIFHCKGSHGTNANVDERVVNFIRTIPTSTLSTIKDTDGGTLLHIACRFHSRSVLETLVDCGMKDYLSAQNNQGQSALHVAAQDGFLDGVRFLISEESAVDAVDNFGSTPLMDCVRHHHLQCAKALLQANASPDSKGLKGWTALHFAASHGDLRAVELLLAYRADVNATTYLGQTPLHLATKENNLSVVQFLLSRFAKRHMEDAFGNTPASLARLSEDPAAIRAFSSTTSIPGLNKSGIGQSATPHVPIYRRDSK